MQLTFVHKIIHMNWSKLNEFVGQNDRYELCDDRGNWESHQKHVFQRKSFIKDEKPMRFICCCFNTVDRKQGVSKLNVSKIQKTYPAQGRGVAKYLCKKGMWGIHYIRNFIFSKRTAPNSKVIWSKIFLGGKNSVLSRKDMLFALNL